MAEAEDRSFGAVEDKLCEAEYFLRQIGAEPRWRMESRYYFSAFVSSARSVTWAMQASLRHVDGFEAWYQGVQSRLREQPSAQFFVETRNRLEKRGHNPLNRIDLADLPRLLHQQLQGNHSHFLLMPSVDSDSKQLVDALAACEAYFSELVAIVWECYDRFRCVVDPRWYFTEANFARMKRTLEDAVEEAGFPRGWLTAVPGLDSAPAWRLLRREQPSCALNHLFEQYLGRSIPDPDGDAEEDTGCGTGSNQEGWILPKALQRTGDPELDMKHYLEGLRRSRDERH